VNVGILPNHVNLCLNFLSLSLFHFILFIIVVHSNNKTTLASIHFEGEAQLWYQILLSEGREIGWGRVHGRCLPASNLLLTKLQQERSVKEYQARYESLLSKIGTLTNNQHVSCFVNGLKEPIKADNMIIRPFTLTSAIVLARVYEARNLALKKNFHRDTRGDNC
jgi:hypothetical protein